MERREVSNTRLIINHDLLFYPPSFLCLMMASMIFIALCLSSVLLVASATLPISQASQGCKWGPQHSHINLIWFVRKVSNPFCGVLTKITVSQDACPLILVVGVVQAQVLQTFWFGTPVLVQVGIWICEDRQQKPRTYNHKDWYKNIEEKERRKRYRKRYWY